MIPSQVERNKHILAQLLKSVITERYKRMAKEEVLSRFLSKNLDPVLLIDLHLRMERDAIELAEMSLLELVTSDRINSELKRSALRIQQAYQEIYGEEVVPDFSGDSLVDLRMRCFRARLDMYNSFLTVTAPAKNSLELAALAFQRAERFQKKLSAVCEVDRFYGDELVRQTSSIHRFMMRKQLDYEILKSEEVWLEFKTEAFKEPQALP